MASRSAPWSISETSALVKLDRALSDVDGFVRHVDSKIDPLSASLNQVAGETRTTMAQAQEALARLTPAATATLADYQALAQDTRRFVANADAQLEILSTSVQQALADTHGVLGEDSASLRPRQHAPGDDEDGEVA